MFKIKVGLRFGDVLCYYILQKTYFLGIFPTWKTLARYWSLSEAEKEMKELQEFVKKYES